MKSRLVVRLILLLLVAGALAAVAIESGGDRERRAENAAGRTPLGKFLAIEPPEPTPAVRFTDLAGAPASLHDFAGKAVLVNLWATWCLPCRREMPSLERLQQHVGDKLAIVAISEDMGGAKVVDPFVAKLGLKRIALYLDPKMAVGRAFKVDGLPTSVLIDGDGKLVGRVEGEAQWDGPKMLAAIAPFLPKDGALKTASPRESP